MTDIILENLCSKMPFDLRKKRRKIFDYKSSPKIHREKQKPQEYKYSSSKLKAQGILIWWYSDAGLSDQAKAHLATIKRV